jgi:kynurenine formamidase
VRLVDLTHPWNLHTPGWVGYPGAKIYYTQTLQTNRIVSQRIETSLHTGTHLDGPMHGTDGGLDMASLPLEKLVHEGVIVDVSDVCSDWDVIKPEHAAAYIASRFRCKNPSIVEMKRGLFPGVMGKVAHKPGAALPVSERASDAAQELSLVH